MTNGKMDLKPGLYVTATPIGNLGDITYRAVNALKEADLILCEDTRQTAKLCAAYGVKRPLAPYHDHNAEKARPGIIKKLQEGARVCLVSDAGTPLVADPGYKLVRDARAAGVDVFPLPGASAAIAALCASGAPSDRFFFAGFLPSKSGARRAALEALKGVDATLIFYETAPRLSASLAAMAETLGDRTAVVARELTKLHETFREGALSELSAFYKAQPVKGEIVVLTHPPAAATATPGELDSFLREALGEMSLKDAASAAAKALGVKRSEAYARALQLKNAP